LGHSRRFGRLRVTSGLPRTSDIIRSSQGVSSLPIPDYPAPRSLKLGGHRGRSGRIECREILDPPINRSRRQCVEPFLRDRAHHELSRLGRYRRRRQECRCKQRNHHPSDEIPSDEMQCTGSSRVHRVSLRLLLGITKRSGTEDQRTIARSPRTARSPRRVCAFKREHRVM
jgi:hypothetical protein